MTSLVTDQQQVRCALKTDRFLARKHASTYTDRRPQANVDMDDFFDAPMHTQHKTTTFTMSTKSISGERNTAGDFQSPCPSGRKDRPRKGDDMDRGEILTIPSSQSDSESEKETHVKKKAKSPRSGRRSQRSAKSTATSSSARSKTLSGGSYSSTNTGSDTDTGSNSCDNGVDSGRRAPSPRKSESDSKHNRERRTAGDRNAVDPHKQAWGADTVVVPQKTVERPKTAHHRRVNSHDDSDRLKSRRRHSSSGSRSYSSDSRSRSRSRSRDNSSRSRSASDSSSCSTLTSTDSDASDVTDVSPLNSPTHKMSTPDMRQWEQCQLGGKPPRSPANKGGYSQRSRPDSALGSCRENLNLLQANSDTMDLKFLMQAVMEMEREKSSSREPHVFFQPGGMSTKQSKQLMDSRQNFSFTNDKVRDIDTENQRLMRQILKYTAKKQASPKSDTSQVTEERVVVKKRQPPASSAVPHLTPSAINRMREQRRIERDNQALLKRLQKTRPTRTLQRDGLLDDYNKQLLAGLSIAAYHPPVKATHPKSRPNSTAGSVYTNSATSLRTEFTPSTTGLRRPQSATLASRPAPDKRRRPHSATTRPSSGKTQGKVRPLSATLTRKVTRQRGIQPAWEPGW